MGRLGRFELLLELAKGGMATLYLARIQGPQGFQKLLALKRVHDEHCGKASFVRMFLDEARLAAQIQHGNVATVFDMGQVDSTYFFTMEYVHGVSLNAVLREATRIPGHFQWYHGAQIVADAAAGLHAAHELRDLEGKPLRVVHRDISPQNILVSYEGAVKVVDFGIAYAAERLTTTSSGVMKGKASYMSPEQVMGETVDHRSDIFSLGIVLWEAVLLQRLFREKSSAAALMRIRDGDISRPRSLCPDLPLPLERIILKALAHRPENRFQTMAEMERALRDVLDDFARPAYRDSLRRVMRDLFCDQKRRMDQQIHAACQLYQPPEAYDVSPPFPTILPSSAGTAPSLGEQADHTGSLWARWRSWGIASGLALLTAGTVLVLSPPGNKRLSDAFSSEKPTRKRTATPQTPRPAASMSPTRGQTRPRAVSIAPARTRESVRLDVAVFPSTSHPTVWVDGIRYSAPLLRLTFRRRDGTVPVLVTAPGFHSYRGELDLRRDGSHLVRLRAFQPKRLRRARRRYPHPREPPPKRPMKSNYADLIKPL